MLAIFVSALKYALNVSFGESPGSVFEKPRVIDKFIILICLAVLLVLGLWIPAPFSDFLKDAASIVEHGVRL